MNAYENYGKYKRNNQHPRYIDLFCGPLQAWHVRVQGFNIYSLTYNAFTAALPSHVDKSKSLLVTTP